MRSAMPALIARLAARPLRAAIAVFDRIERPLLRLTLRAAEDLALATRFRLRPDDVFLVGFPRSGLTLLQMALVELTTGGETAFAHLASVSPTLELELVRGAPAHLEKLPSPRLLKSHLTYERLPRGGRVIYLARDVRDVAVSARRYCGLLAGRDPDLDSFLRDFVRGHPALGGTWFEHLRSWWPHRRDPDILFLDYDEAVADLPGALRRVAGFCGLALDERDLPRLLERCSFEHMQRHEARFDSRLRHLGGPVETFVRKGKAGLGKVELPSRHRDEMARRAHQLARKLGCGPGDPHTGLFALD